MPNNILVYIPSETKSSSYISMKRFLGVPQFLRGILTLEEVEPRKVMFLAPISERRHMLRAWKRYSKNKNISPHFVWTPINQKIDFKIFSDIIANSSENITILNANLVLTKTALNPWKNINLKNGQHLKAVIDRGLPPLMVFRRSDLEIAAERFENSPATFEDILWSAIKKTKSHPASEKWSEPVKLLTRFTNTHEVSKFLADQIRLNTHSWVARNINKRISLPISLILAKLRISPNSITVFNMLIGMAASIGAAGRTYTGLLLGAILFQLASIIDGCDGEVAKLTLRNTKFGQYIDSISDNLALGGFITGLMIHVYRVNNHTPWAFVLGGSLLLGIGILIGIMINFLKKNTNSASFVTFDKEYLEKLPDFYPKPLLTFIKYFKYTMKKDFFSFMFMVLAIFGVLPWALYISVVGAWCAVFILSYLSLKANSMAKTHSPSHKIYFKKKNGVCE